MRRANPLCPILFGLTVMLPLAALFSSSLATQPDDVMLFRLHARNESLGRLATDYLHAIQRDSAPELKRIIESHLAKRILDLRGVDGWTEAHLDIASQITTFEEAVVVENAPLRFEILTSLTGEPDSDEPLEWCSWTFEADPSDPSRALGVRVVDALAPARWAPDYSMQCIADDPATALVNRLLEEIGSPAFAIAIARLDEHSHTTITSAVAGIRRVGSPEAARLDDPFHIGSCTKSATALLMATLVAEGRLDWFDTIDSHLGADFEIHEAYRRVTLADVLRHRAGLAGHSAGIAAAIDRYSRLDGAPTQQRATYLAEVLATAPSVPSGEMHYSNAGYCLIAHVCERLLDHPYEQAIEQRVFNPLGITTAAFGWPVTSTEPDGIWGHSFDDETGQLVPFEEDLILGSFLAPAGDLHVKIEDFAMIALQQTLGPRGRSPLASAPDFAELHRTGTGSSYAAGVAVFHRDGHRYIDHTGSTGIHWAAFRAWPELGLAAVVATNGPINEDQERHVDAALRALANHAARD